MPPSFRSLLLCLCIALPWINPFAPGPSASIGPWLFSVATASLFTVAYALAPATERAATHLAGLAQRAWVAAALVSAIIAFIQYFGWASHFQGLISQPYHHGQAFGNLRQRNQLSSLMAIGLAALWLRKPGTSVLWCIGLMAAATAATTSRAGVLQIIALAGMAFVWGRAAARPVWPGIAVAAASYLACSVAFPVLLELTSGERPEDILDRTVRTVYCGGRTPLWANVLYLIGQRPWTGWGWGELDYAHFVTVFPGMRFCDIMDNAHNLPLHLAVELGVPVTLMVCGLLAWAVVRLVPWRETDQSRQMAWMVIVVIGIHSMVEYPLWYGPFQMAVGLSVALLWLTRRGQAKPDSAVSPARLRFVAGGAGLVLIASCYAGWDYGRVSQLYLPSEQRRADLRDDTLAKVGNSWLFRDHVDFARLSTAARTPQDAPVNLEMARRLLHFSPEPMVVEMEIESLLLLGREQEAMSRMAHYRYAFPAEYIAWRKKMGL